MTFLFDSANLPFMIALGLMVSIGLLEGVTTLLGFGLSSFIDSMFPDVDFDVDVDVGVDADVDVDVGGGGPGGGNVDGLDLHQVGSPNALSRLLGWFHVGRVPILVLLVIFLFSFSIAGLAVQAVFESILGHLLPGLLATLPALALALPSVHFSGGVLARIIPKDETDAVSERTFVGRVGRITLGSARRGQPAQAKLRDVHGRTHYVMVEPDNEGVTLESGTDVVIVRRAGAVFYAIINTSDALVDE